MNPPEGPQNYRKEYQHTRGLVNQRRKICPFENGTAGPSPLSGFSDGSGFVKLLNLITEYIR